MEKRISIIEAIFLNYFFIKFNLKMYTIIIYSSVLDQLFLFDIDHPLLNTMIIQDIIINELKCLFKQEILL